MHFSKEDIVVKEGRIDLEASVAKMVAEFSEFVRFEEESTKNVHECLTAVFAKFPGAKFNQKYIVGQTMRALEDNGKATGANWTKYEEKTVELLKAMQAMGGIVEVKRGRGGGTTILAPAPKAE